MLLLTGEICEDGSMPRLSIGIPAILPDGASELTAKSARPNSTYGYSYLPAVRLRDLQRQSAEEFAVVN
jgi:hypothetical protein